MMSRFLRRLYTTIILLLVAVNISPSPLGEGRGGASLSPSPFGEGRGGASIALVLGGGGAKGAAHVGVLKVIEEAGIRPDIIVGTSIGAIVGGLYSVGYTATDLDSLFRSQQWAQLFTREAIRGNAIKTMLDSLVLSPPLRGEDGRGLFACIASDLRTLSDVVLSDDSLARNMRASMAIPALFKAVRFDDYVLYDGGLTNNLPVDVARQMGADLVIAIDLTVNHHDDDPGDDFDELREIFDITQVKGIVGWFLNRPDFKKHRQNKTAADIYINPDLEGYSAVSFGPKSIAEMIAIGENAARQQFQALQNLAP
ncbi:MAG: patatin-like phospholipase family protein [Prevotella sp.]|nr:patatin-like phospholipase family protein [Prevotella sp.]